MRLDINVQYHALTELVPKSRWIGSHFSISDAGPEAAEHGDADFFVFRTDFIFRYGLTDRTELSLDLPYVRNEVKTDESDEHHRNEVLEGLGDIRLSMKHFFVAGQKLQVAGIFGLSFPTGKIKKVTRASFVDHDEAHEVGITIPWHTHLRLGTGTFDPFLGVEALYRFDKRWMMYGNVLANLPFYENRYGYRTSPNISLTVGPAVHIGKRPVIVALFANIYYAGRDQFRGHDLVGAGGGVSGKLGVPNTGRFEFSLQPNLTWAVNKNLTLNLSLNVPIYTRIRTNSLDRDVQLTEQAGVFLGMSWHP